MYDKKFIDKKFRNLYKSLINFFKKKKVYKSKASSLLKTVLVTRTYSSEVDPSLIE